MLKSKPKDKKTNKNKKQKIEVPEDYYLIINLVRYGEQ